MYLQEERQVEDCGKSVNVITNGLNGQIYCLEYSSVLTFNMIQRSFQARHQTKLRRMRLFNDEGVQFNNEDLRYVKVNQNLYVSKGEDFDANSSYGEYEILQLLGQGGFGKVSLAKHRILEELVAIKVMKMASFGNTSQIDSVFRQAQSLQALDHPGVVQILKYYTLKDMQVVVVMEYMAGGELLGRLRTKERFQEQEAKEYFQQIIKAVDYCHSKNIIHRDLKLQNILLKSDTQNKVKIADFGISGVAKNLNPKISWGTLKYMSPEVLSKVQKENTPAVDVWALGCILYYMLVGKLPFSGRSNQATIQLIKAGEFSIPKSLKLSPQVTQLVERMLDRNPFSRIKVHQIRDYSWLRSKVDLMMSPKPQKQDNKRMSIKPRVSMKRFSKQLQLKKLVLSDCFLPPQAHRASQQLQLPKLNSLSQSLVTIVKSPTKKPKIAPRRNTKKSMALMPRVFN